VSAHNGLGLPELLEKIDGQLIQDPVSRHCFRLPLGEGRPLHLLHERAAVLSQEYKDEYCEVVADVPQSILSKLAPFAIH
jgi:50S ribosomal subunit-associated GTPase HflX